MTAMPTVAAPLNVDAVDVADAEVVTFAALAIMFTPFAVAHALPEIDIDTIPTAAAPLLYPDRPSATTRLPGDARKLVEPTSTCAQLEPPVHHEPAATDSDRPLTAVPRAATLVTVAPTEASIVVLRTYVDASVVGAIAPTATFAATA